MIFAKNLIKFMYNITCRGRVGSFHRGQNNIGHYDNQRLVRKQKLGLKLSWKPRKCSTQNVGKILDSIFSSEYCFPPAWTYSIENL